MQQKVRSRSPKIIAGGLVLALAAGAAWWWQARQAAQAGQRQAVREKQREAEGDENDAGDNEKFPQGWQHSRLLKN